jgi:DMSO/TMAO reductase YedYZ heme-binding membrane subunit
MKENDIRFAKLLVLVNCCRAGGTCWAGMPGTISSAPTREFRHPHDRHDALIFLVLTMAVTPLRKITGWNWLIFPGACSAFTPSFTPACIS